ncbi:MAG TPA: 4Fe-4S dicluster domain-containing protein [Bacteroidetes bacterium]|nr:4Fe-4S dicluster domain-containing protein [Bacteroidota bacterium]
MGHIANAKSSLVPLIDRLNKYPIGLVDNEILRELLSLLFDEKEAFVGSKFPLEEATLSELGKATKMNADELLPVLESMADKGLIMDMPYGEEIYYLLMPGVIGFFEFTFMKHRKDIPVEKVAGLMTKYFHDDPQHGQAKEFLGTKNQLTRSLVYEEHIPVNSEVVSYESAREIIKNSNFGAAGMCYCRHKKEHEGKTCRKGAPVENVCISLGNGARFLSRRGFAQQKSKEELLEIIDMAHHRHLTHLTDNIRNKPTFICNCCSCCCEIMAGVQMGYFDGVAKTSYIATIDPELCDYCGECFTACNVGAIGLKRSNDGKEKEKRVSEVKQEICLGCGACISACEKGSISLTLRENYVRPKKNKRDLFKSVLIEKHRLSPFITGRVKKEAKKLFMSNG